MVAAAFKAVVSKPRAIASTLMPKSVIFKAKVWSFKTKAWDFEAKPKATKIGP